mgnify:CR=1 FL=1
MRRTAALVNLGCRVNRVELDAMACDLEAAGFELVGEDEASYIVINTCAVTGEAEAKTRKAIRHAALRPQSPVVVATGCVASLFADELAALAPNVRVVADKRRVASAIVSDAEVNHLSIMLGCQEDNGKVTPTGRTRPGVQVQDGCDNRCTYCIIWKARGKARSFSPDEALSGVRAAMSRGAKEVVLTGINLGDYRWSDGRDELRLPGLLELLLRETEVDRLRISSIEPPDVNADLVDAMAKAGERVAPFLHMCLQSGCDRTLERMHRVYRTDLFRANVQAARAALPHLSLGTDLIVGFPGETDEDFEESLAFCKEMRFSRMHVFRYSRRPGTPAAEYSDQVDPQVMAERAARARKLARELRHEEAARLVGTEGLVVVQYPGRGVDGGLFDVQVDPGVPVDSFIRVRHTGVRDDGTLVAEQLG